MKILVIVGQGMRSNRIATNDLMYYLSHINGDNEFIITSIFMDKPFRDSGLKYARISSKNPYMEICKVDSVIFAGTDSKNRARIHLERNSLLVKTKVYLKY